MRSADTRVRRLLNSIQRPFLQWLSPNYRTPPTTALQVLAGIAPLYSEAEVKYEQGRTKGQMKKRIINRWQQEWERGLAGRPVFRLIREISDKPWKFNWKATDSY